MSGDILTYPTDSAVSADDFVSTEKVSGGRVFRQKVNPENLKVRNTAGVSQTLSALADTVGGGSVAGNAATVGAINATTGLSVDVKYGLAGNFLLTFTLAAVSLTVTDAGASGASGSLKLFDFVQAGVVALACRQDYTAFAEGAALTGAAGDAAFVMGLGSVAANAGDGVLTSTEVDFGAVTSTITLSAGTATATKFSCVAAVFDGTGTAVDLYLNWCGSAATIDANSTISVTGTITVAGILIGDD